MLLKDGVMSSINLLKNRIPRSTLNQVQQTGAPTLQLTVIYLPNYLLDQQKKTAFFDDSFSGITFGRNVVSSLSTTITACLLFASIA